VEFAKKHQNCHSGLDPESSLSEEQHKKLKILKQVQDDKAQVFAILGVHPHDAADFAAENLRELEKLAAENPEIVVGIGEIGLDYFYEFSPRAAQQEILEMQLGLALKLDLPISFHVRDDHANSGAVWRDFWRILDNNKIRGVLHSYTDQNRDNLKKALEEGLYIGVNGIATFAKENEQDLWRVVPLDRMILETDAPFLAPVPFRGRVNRPSFIPKIVEFLSNLRDESYDEIAQATTENAKKLFTL